jgi:cysteinyl-tRNA synthetase
LDFSLWKKVKENELGFDSPWGKGRPGWHIECTVMSQRYLGDQIDIHGGALDLIFPHHENEVAQSEALTGKKPFVRYWLHTGFLNSSGEKMSKSLGNIVAVREFVKTQSPQAFRLFILQTHYRSPIDYSTENVSNAARAVERLIAFRTSLNTTATTAKGTEQEAASVSGKLISSFNAAMDDDFNTPRAVSAIFEAVRDLNGIIARGNDSKESLLGSLRAFDEVTNVLGLALNKESIELTSDEKALVTERNNHRAQKNWAEADRIRKLLLEQGLSLRDKSDGTTVVERVSL